jgi:XTP/dITP diphosphohydrolase
MPRSSAHVPRKALIVATANPGKLHEFRALLADLAFDICSLAERGIASPEESGASFLANAVLKARHAAAAADAAALADDSGLEVDALGGAPGIFSARYAGRGADDAANNAKLQQELRDVPLARRSARYRCVLAYVDDATAAPVIAQGVWEGLILEAPRGAGGFGYDPYVWLPQLALTAAELPLAEKNRLSHRGIALRSMREQLAKRRPELRP